MKFVTARKTQYALLQFTHYVCKHNANCAEEVTEDSFDDEDLEELDN